MTAKKRIIDKPKPEPPAISAEKGIELLEKQINRAEELLAKKPLVKDDYSAWENITQACLEKAFGLNSPNINKVLHIGKYGSFPMNAGKEYWENHRVKSLISQISMLKSQIELLKMEMELDPLKNSNEVPKLESIITRDIFLVHGQNEGTKEAVARFLEKLEISTIILHEQPNKGRTIIEKFTDYSNVGFAIIIMTSDDIGGTAGSNYEDLVPRARQNVLFELGYFIGKLGRQKVCALYQEKVEIPSDYNGVLFVKIDDAGAWRMQLAKEIKAAGIDVDMNKAI